MQLDLANTGEAVVAVAVFDTAVSEAKWNVAVVDFDVEPTDSVDGVDAAVETEEGVVGAAAAAAVRDAEELREEVRAVV